MKIPSLGKKRFLVLRVSQQLFGIEISWVQQVESMKKIVRLPSVSSYIKGVINLHGEIVPTIYLQGFLQERHATEIEGNRMVIVGTNEDRVALIVDEVKEVVEVDLGKVEPMPGLEGGYNAPYFLGLGRYADTFITYIDLLEMLERAFATIA